MENNLSIPICNITERQTMPPKPRQGPRKGKGVYRIGGVDLPYDEEMGELDKPDPSPLFPVSTIESGTQIQDQSDSAS